MRQQALECRVARFSAERACLQCSTRPSKYHDISEVCDGHAFHTKDQCCKCVPCPVLQQLHTLFCITWKQKYRKSWIELICHARCLLCALTLIFSLAPQSIPVQPSHSQSSWSSGQGFQEFVPSTDYASQIVQQSDSNAAAATMLGYTDPFAMASGVQGISSSHVAATLNPYAQDPSSMTGAAYYQSANAFAQPVSRSSFDVR